MVLALVRDLEGTRVVYYWIDKAELERVSPVLSSFQLAEEWRLRFLHDSHKGKNRRSSFIDRRKVSKDKPSDQRARGAKALGRRASDSPARVDMDIAKVKLAELRLVYEEDLLHPSDIDQKVLFDAKSKSPRNRQE